MTVGRRGFLRSAAAGGAACLVGCGTSAPSLEPDAGSGCELPPTSPPPALDYPSSDYFAQIARDLDDAGLGTPVVFLDMDRVDANIDAIANGIAPNRYRIVEKSLPSLDLLAYVSSRSGSSHFLVLHLPFLPDLIASFPGADVLMGKTHLTSAIARVFDAQPRSDIPSIARRVTFLIDDPARLDELAALGASLGVPLRVAIELDVGLRRSGVADPSEVPPLLSVFTSTTNVEFAGFLGYDGHVAHTPGRVEDAWTEATAAYQAFVAVLESDFPALASRPDLLFHSGGSATYPMYTSGTPVNDVAAGGGVLRPGAYLNHVISDLLPAIFIATPVLKQYSEPRLPFFSPEASARLFRGRQGLTLYGGGWPAYFTHPADIQPAPLVSDPTDVNLVPNQGLVTAPADTPIRPGDWVFYHPRQSDALFQFEHILQVRGGRIQSATMMPFPRRY